MGVYLGLTTLALAQTIPSDGTVIALEAHEPFVDLARPFWREAGIEEKIDVRIGLAHDSLKAIKGAEFVDLLYIDCNKPGYVDYVTEAIRLIRVKGLILVDNTLWKAKVLDKSDETENTVGIRAVNEFIRGLDPTMFKIVNLTVGDGLTMICKLRSNAIQEVKTMQAEELDQPRWHELSVRALPFRVNGVVHEGVEKWTEEYLVKITHDEPVKLTTRKEFDSSVEVTWQEAVHQIFQARTKEQGSLYLQQTHPPASLEKDITVPRYILSYRLVRDSNISL